MRSLPLSMAPSAHFHPSSYLTNFAKAMEGVDFHTSSLFMAAPSDAEHSTTVSICEAKINTALSPTSLTITGQNDDPNGSHISIDIVSEAFTGCNKVKRSQMVYKAIWEEMNATSGIVHAVDSMSCRTPAEDRKW